jgi:ribosome-binding factor A
MKERVARLAAEIREIIGQIVARQEIKDPRVQEGGLITITHVRLTGDLRQATALFTVHDADARALARVKQGLDHASGYLRRRLGQELSVRTIPTVTFEIDRVFDQEARVDALLREVAASAPPPDPEHSDQPSQQAPEQPSEQPSEQNDPKDGETKGDT